MVMASKNSCTPPGTPLEVTFARRKNASAITMTAAMALDRTVSVLTVSPNQLAVVCSPTSMFASARSASVIAAFPPLSTAAARSRLDGSLAHLPPHRQSGAEHQQHLEKRQSKNYAQPLRPEGKRDDQSDHGDNQQPPRRIQRHLLFQRMRIGGDHGDRTPHAEGVEQTHQEPDPEEHPDHRMVEPAGGGDRRRGQGKGDDEQPNRPERNGRKHQRRVLRWRSHSCTSVLARGSCLVDRCVARRAYRRAFGALESPKELLPMSVVRRRDRS